MDHCRFHARIDVIDTDTTVADVTVEEQNVSPLASRSRSAQASFVTSATSKHAHSRASISSTSSVAVSTSSTLPYHQYPAGIPHSNSITQPMHTLQKFYVVFAGTWVGIFGNWFDEVLRYTQGISGSHQCGFRTFNDALEAYRAAYEH
ncbi:hypothetical protein BT96DRAFT_940475 [Gymnopus androsaceus JB14]|uniref:Ribonuclease H1 N-terminal domain-containing protein n=1 Tax=Gymnopus androsaceus JB14 TaxID=1447944 RepID=A0A6A4HJB5_9AGAR|nr:hypothetical protein BT96DRAFT_940475 [Gymnopus androsaceus JB14]